MANKNEVLADILRPQSFDDIVGQAHLFGERGILRRMMEKGRMSNMIFFGPPGTGKTTAASIIAKQSGMNFYKLNATSASLSDVKDIIAQTNNVFGFGGILLYIDEIQYFNRKQQQALLEYMEDGRITLIACPKLDPVDHSEKLAEIFKNNEISSVTLLRMEVPCCGGLQYQLMRALEKSGKQIPVQVAIVSTDGKIL